MSSSKGTLGGNRRSSSRGSDRARSQGNRDATTTTVTARPLLLFGGWPLNPAAGGSLSPSTAAAADGEESNLGDFGGRRNLPPQHPTVQTVIGAEAARGGVPTVRQMLNALDQDIVGWIRPAKYQAAELDSADQIPLVLAEPVEP